MDKTYFQEFSEWKTSAEVIGWVHTHDNFLVCDTDEFEGAGEWDDELEVNNGWIFTELLECSS